MSLTAPTARHWTLLSSRGSEETSVADLTKDLVLVTMVDRVSAA